MCNEFYNYDKKVKRYAYTCTIIVCRQFQLKKLNCKEEWSPFWKSVVQVSVKKKIFFQSGSRNDLLVVEVDLVSSS